MKKTMRKSIASILCSAAALGVVGTSLAVVADSAVAHAEPPPEIKERDR